jgi:hypothetical protein
MDVDSASRRACVSLTLMGIALATLTSGCVFGGLRGNPGYAAFGSPGAADTNRDFALSLGPLPLKIARVFMKNDPEIQTLLHDVKAVRVYTYEVDGDAERVKQNMADARDRLVAHGWEQILAVRDDGELVSALVKTDGAASMRGLAVMVQDHDDLTFVNVIGRLKPETFGAVMAQLNVHLPSVRLADSQRESEPSEEAGASGAAAPVTAFAGTVP